MQAGIASYRDQVRGRKSSVRISSEQAVWALANRNLIVTPAMSEVVDAAKQLVISWGEFNPESEHPDDARLYEAVQDLKREENDRQTVRLVQNG